MPRYRRAPHGGASHETTQPESRLRRQPHQHQRHVTAPKEVPTARTLFFPDYAALAGPSNGSAAMLQAGHSPRSKGMRRGYRGAMPVGAGWALRSRGQPERFAGGEPTAGGLTRTPRRSGTAISSTTIKACQHQPLVLPPAVKKTVPTVERKGPGCPGPRQTIDCLRAEPRVARSWR